jgi:pyruvate formate lyase activating enzyme
MNKDAFIGISRHRLGTDGQGVTTLAAFYGCPLRCKYCLNPHSWRENDRLRHYTPSELYELLKIDQLYFIATGGGVTFGGGEPLLRPEYLAEFRALCGDGWRLCVETSLNVPWAAVEMAAGCIDEFIVDCKDTNPAIYEAYTGQDNAKMLQNLRCLASLIPPERMIVRLPLIEGYNTDEDRDASEARLRSYGIERFDRFTYKTDINK